MSASPPKASEWRVRGPKYPVQPIGNLSRIRKAARLDASICQGHCQSTCASKDPRAFCVSGGSELFGCFCGVGVSHGLDQDEGCSRLIGLGAWSTMSDARPGRCPRVGVQSGNCRRSRGCPRSTTRSLWRVSVRILENRYSTSTAWPSKTCMMISASCTRAPVMQARALSSRDCARNVESWAAYKDGESWTGCVAGAGART